MKGETVIVKPTEAQYANLEREVTNLFKRLKHDIADDYRASGDDTCPGMCVGGAYSHRFWGVVSLYRRSNSKEMAHNAVEEIADGIASSTP